MKSNEPAIGCFFHSWGILGARKTAWASQVRTSSSILLIVPRTLSNVRASASSRMARRNDVSWVPLHQCRCLHPVALALPPPGSLAAHPPPEASTFERCRVHFDLRGFSPAPLLAPSVHRTSGPSRGYGSASPAAFQSQWLVDCTVRIGTEVLSRQPLQRQKAARACARAPDSGRSMRVPSCCSGRIEGELWSSAFS
jgi:hypothetical protein